MFTEPLLCAGMRQRRYLAMLAAARMLLRTIKHLWEASKLIHTLHWDACCLNCFGAAASRYNLIASLCKSLSPTEPFAGLHNPGGGMSGMLAVSDSKRRKVALAHEEENWYSAMANLVCL